MSNEKWAPNENQWPECLQGNIVLEKEVTPSHLTDKFRRSWPAKNLKRESFIPLALRDDAHILPERHKFAREELAGRFNPPCAGVKAMRAKQDFQNG
jgi:hypothetical protein